ncbi:MAG: tetratricopeptide repeat protein [Aureliella sp.]
MPLPTLCHSPCSPGPRLAKHSISPWAKKATAVLLGLFALCLVGCSGSSSSVAVSKSTGKFDISEATYVGRDSCVKCHQDQADKFSGSHHDKAMQPANESTVLGDFSDATLVHHGVESRMYRDGDKYMIHTEGPDGRMIDYQIRYVFGLEPLQQYMVDIPTPDQANADGEPPQRDGTAPRVQVLRISWDTEKKAWFYLPPPDVEDKLASSDDLHWTGIAQRWNTMCAECHSTNYQKQFEVPESHMELASLSEDAGSAESMSETIASSNLPASVGKYNSTYFEIDVSCEACHGPGSVHTALAAKWFPGWSREKGFGLADLKSTAENQIQACAPCHSRRNVIAGDFTAGDNFYDHYGSQLIAQNIYYPDGQILDEDYVHGSFIQSKMYHKGIRCSDCHDPHSARLKHTGNQVCTSCHQHPVAKYDSVSHHFHKPGTPGAQCVNCHMPSTTYMEVDARRDHSLRIPRPDLSQKLGTPNACTGCHLDENNVAADKRESLELYQDWMLAARNGDAEVQAELDRADKWCDEACDKWYGEKRMRDTHFGEAIAAAQNQDPDASDRVTELLKLKDHRAPALARASALEALRASDPRRAGELAAESVDDPSPIVRGAAAAALTGHANSKLAVTLIESLLADDRRSVRVEAARNILSMPSNLWSSSASAKLRSAIEELTAGLKYSADRSGAHVSLGILAEQQGRNQQGIQHYQDAIAVESAVTGPRTNLATLLESNLAQQTSGGKIQAQLAETVRALRLEELRLLERDVNLLPDSAALSHRYGLALYLNRDSVDGALEKSATYLTRAAELDPRNPQFAQLAAMIYQKLERWEPALKWAEKALRLSGDDPQYRLLYNEIRQQSQQQVPGEKESDEQKSDQ